MAELKYTVEKTGKDLTVIRLSGEFEGYSVLNNKDALLEHVRQNTAKNLMIDFAEIEYIDSAAVGALLEMMKQAQSQKTSFGLLHVNEDVKKVLVVTKLDKILKIYE